MTSTKRSKNTSAEDSLKGDAPKQAQALHGAAVPAMRTEAAASEAVSATDTGGSLVTDPGADTAASRLFPEATSSLPPVSLAPSAPHPSQVDGATLAPLAQLPEPGAAGGGGRDDDTEDGDAWIVTCSREGGRRRAGRRWAFGQTPAEDLTAEDIAALAADPSFALRRVTMPQPLTEF